jgi:teichuronic acid biosynthesis glycosyltransferase TuaC
VVSNMASSAAAPQRGSFVRDQVAALRGLGCEVDAFDWQPGSRNYPPAVRAIRRRLRERRYDVVHAHYGLAGWCAALAGADPLVVTFHGTDVRHRLVGPLSRMLCRRGILIAAASKALFASESGRPGLPLVRGRSAILPSGADLSRFRPLDPAEARRELGLDPDGRYLLFPADPARPVKRADRAREVADLAEAELLTLGGVDPREVGLLVNSAAAVLITSDNEGFGLAAVEALSCGVPLISTPVGAIPHLAGGLERCLVAPFDAELFAASARPLLDGRPVRIEATARSVAFGAERTAERVLAAYRDVAGIA